VRRVTYSELTLRYFMSDALAGVLSGPDTYRGAAGSRAQGTWVQFDVKTDATADVKADGEAGVEYDANGRIGAARFLAFGCPHTIAVSAWIAAHAAGLAVRRALPVSVADLSERFDVPVEKRGRLVIIEDAWMAAMTAARQN
jgi:NifU-like protein involved in Fe-S cluster formation